MNQAVSIEQIQVLGTLHDNRVRIGAADTHGTVAGAVRLERGLQPGLRFVSRAEFSPRQQMVRGQRAEQAAVRL